jgi:hypothetical protein
VLKVKGATGVFEGPAALSVGHSKACTGESEAVRPSIAVNVPV